MKMHAEVKWLAKQDPADPWGDALSVQFAICDVLLAADETIPAAWEFQAAAASYADTVDDLADNVDGNVAYSTEVLAAMYRDREITGDQLRYAGNVLARYADVLKLAGLDY